jgi:hypothetical protein
MKVLITQYDNRPQIELGAFIDLVNQNSEYAKRYGYEYIFINSVNLQISPYWTKVFIVEHYMKYGYDIVMWLDTDAVIHNFDIKIEELFTDNEVFIFSPDSPPWNSPFNAGVFICKGIRGRELMEEWKSYYPSDLWFESNGKWHCKSDKWSDSAYEQGAFRLNLLPKYANSGLLKSYSWEFLQSPYPQPESFTVHFAGEHKINILIYQRTKK